MVHQSLKWNLKKGGGGEEMRPPHRKHFPPKPLLWPLTLKYGRNVTISCMPTFVCQWHHPAPERFILSLSLSVQHNHYHNHNWKCSSSSFLAGNLLARVWIPLSEAMQQNIAFYKCVLSKNVLNLLILEQFEKSTLLSVLLHSGHPSSLPLSSLWLLY